MTNDKLTEQLREIVYGVYREEDGMMKTLASFIEDREREAFRDFVDNIKIDQGSVYYQFNPMQQMAVNEYIEEIFTKLEKLCEKSKSLKGTGEDSSQSTNGGKKESRQ
jgi:hypothetical protein